MCIGHSVTFVLLSF